MPARKAQAEWNGDLKSGKGNMSFGGGAFNGAYSFSSRFEEGQGTNPEELIAAAHAGCFSMAFSNILAQNGHAPTSVNTTATVHLEKGEGGFAVTRISLETEGDVPGIDESTFQQHAETAKENCPISKLLKPGAEITLKATLAVEAAKCPVEGVVPIQVLRHVSNVIPDSIRDPAPTLAPPVD